VLEGVLSRLPRTNHCAGAERIAAGAAHRVPIGDREPKMVPHRFAFNSFVFVIMTKRKRGLGFRALEADLRDFRNRGHFQLSPGGSGMALAGIGRASIVAKTSANCKDRVKFLRGSSRHNDTATRRLEYDETPMAAQHRKSIVKWWVMKQKIWTLL